MIEFSFVVPNFTAPLKGSAYSWLGPSTRKRDIYICSVKCVQGWCTIVLDSLEDALSCAASAINSTSAAHKSKRVCNALRAAAKRVDLPRTRNPNGAQMAHKVALRAHSSCSVTCMWAFECCSALLRFLCGQGFLLGRPYVYVWRLLICTDFYYHRWQYWDIFSAWKLWTWNVWRFEDSNETKTRARAAAAAEIKIDAIISSYMYGKYKYT